MKKILIFVALFCSLNKPVLAQWVKLFEGEHLKAWRASESPETFNLTEGSLTVHGPRAHLFYEGTLANHDFKDFELKVKIMTFPQANSGVYIHTDFLEKAWPAKGYEIQVNNSQSDWRRTASLYNIVDVAEVNVPDNEWFDLYISVNGKRIITQINGVTIVDYTEPKKPLRKEGQLQRLLSSGTIAIQGHDPNSKVNYKDLMVKIN
jgi:hypothetical protein